MIAGARLAIQHLRERAQERPFMLAGLRWLPLQDEFHRDTSRRKLIRAGNQLGKTFALAAEAIWRASGLHPWIQMPDGARTVVVISPTNAHSINIQGKIWSMLDPGLIADTRFDPVIGFRGRYPVCRFKNGSIIRFYSAEAGALSLSGITVDDVLIDEPVHESVYKEMERRVMRRNGYILIGLTPINAPGGVDWLRELVALGLVSEHWSPMKAEAFIPVGCSEPMALLDGTPMDQAWIDGERSKVRGPEAAIRLDGEWETPPEGQVFPAFDIRPGGAHVTDDAPTRDLDLYVGIDHGERDHKQCAVLLGVERGTGIWPVVWCLDEYVGDGLTTHEQDAAGILAMLSRWGVSWPALTAVHGDKPHDVHSIVRSAARKSNADLGAALARAQNLPAGRLSPPIRQAKRGAGGGSGSIDRGKRWIHECMLREGHWRVQSRCKRLIESLHKWDHKDNEWKDIIDATRYALWPIVMRQARRPAGVTIRLD